MNGYGQITKGFDLPDGGKIVWRLHIADFKDADDIIYHRLEVRLKAGKHDLSQATFIEAGRCDDLELASEIAMALLRIEEGIKELMKSERR